MNVMSVKEAAACWNLSERWVQKLCEDGLYRGLLLHRPGNGVSVILEFDLAYRLKSNRSLASGVVREEFVGCSKVARLVLPVVEVACHQNLVSKFQRLAPAAFQILRCGRVRQSVGFHCIVDCH